MMWNVMFCGQKAGVYDSWGVCSEYVLGLSGAAYQSYSTRMQAKEAYATFLEHQNKDQKSQHVTRNGSQNMSQTCGVGKIG
jgi:viroplasmin and RNaseH domain-containing protein